jgi:hypothetical protein
MSRSGEKTIISRGHFYCFVPILIPARAKVKDLIIDPV